MQKAQEPLLYIILFLSLPTKIEVKENTLVPAFPAHLAASLLQSTWDTGG